MPKKPSLTQIEAAARAEQPSDIVASFSLMYADTEIEDGAGCDVTRAMLDAFERAAIAGIYGVGVHGVLQRVIEDGARRLLEQLGEK